MTKQDKPRHCKYCKAWILWRYKYQKRVAYNAVFDDYGTAHIGDEHKCARTKSTPKQTSEPDQHPFTEAEMLDILDIYHYSYKVEAGQETWLGLELPPVARYFKISKDALLKALRTVAERYSNTGDKRCTSCGMPIYFKNRVPLDSTGRNHFIACPNREAHRK